MITSSPGQAEKTQETVTANPSQTQGDTIVTADIIDVSTVATTDDSITLDATKKEQVVNNGSANQMQVYPPVGHNFGLGINAATTIAAGISVNFVRYDDTNWMLRTTGTTSNVARGELEQVSKTIVELNALADTIVNAKVVLTADNATPINFSTLGGNIEIEGDTTSVLLGLTLEHLQAVRSPYSDAGSGIITISKSTNTLTFAGASTNPDFSDFAAGGHQVAICIAGVFQGYYEIASIPANNQITFTTEPPTIATDYTVTLIPNITLSTDQNIFLLGNPGLNLYITGCHFENASLKSWNMDCNLFLTGCTLKGNTRINMDYSHFQCNAHVSTIENGDNIGFINAEVSTLKLDYLNMQHVGSRVIFLQNCCMRNNYSAMIGNYTTGLQATEQSQVREDNPDYNRYPLVAGGTALQASDISQVVTRFGRMRNFNIGIKAEWLTHVNDSNTDMTDNVSTAHNASQGSYIQ